MLNKQKFHALFALEPNTLKPFIHKREWAIHDVLPILLSDYGKANVKIITYSISEDSLRTLFLECDAGNVGNLSLLLDHSVRKNKLDLLLFARNFTSEIRLSDVHAKVFLVENERLKFGIAGSANLNKNRRIESGFYFTSGEVFDYFSEQFDYYFESAVKYEFE